jgi:hypothetical protein
MPLNACKMRSMAEPVTSRIKSWKVVLTNMPAKCRHVAFGGIGRSLPVEVSSAPPATLVFLAVPSPAQATYDPDNPFDPNAGMSENTR